MHEYLRFFGTNKQQKVDRFLIYERDLLLRELTIIILDLKLEILRKVEQLLK